MKGLDTRGVKIFGDFLYKLVVQKSALYEFLINLISGKNFIFYIINTVIQYVLKKIFGNSEKSEVEQNKKTITIFLSKMVGRDPTKCIRNEKICLFDNNFNN